MTVGPRPVRVAERPPTDRPRERLAALGPSALSDAELLALLLRTGTAREDVLAFASRVLVALGGLGAIPRMHASELVAIPGIGPATAAEIVAALELGRRAAQRLAADRPQIMRPADAAALLGPRMAHLEQERCVALLLDRKHRLLREVVVGIGGIAHAPMEPREVFAAALREPGVAAVLVAHNHPSGEATPSTEDRAVTRRLADGAALLGLEFLDHVIIASGGWSSIRGER
ncbi:MAG: DNA repair protein RadC [Actinomycetota bacterium]